MNLRSFFYFFICFLLYLRPPYDRGGSDSGRGGGDYTGATASVNMSTAQFQALRQAVRPPNPPQPAPQPAQVTQAQDPTFALTPGQANATQFIDHMTATGIKLWQEATTALPNKFSAEGQDVNQFCEALLERAQKPGWNSNPADIINITVNNKIINLFTGYGRITTQNIRNNSTYIGNQNHQAQNDTQLYHCIMNSLTAEAKRKILAKHD